MSVTRKRINFFVLIRAQKKRYWDALFLSLLFPTILLYAQPFINNPLLEGLDAEHGEFAYNRGVALNELIESLRGKQVKDQLKKVNQHFNQYKYKDDYAQWGKRDYWQTPVEFVGSNNGDCEDYVIAKYFVLRFLGVAESKLYLTYVKAKGIDVAHMVLSYFETPKSTPLVLDNYNEQVLPANKRKDLLPVYSFNAKSLFLSNPAAGLGKKLPTDKIKNSKWTALLKTLEKVEK
jgi:predicted transglutaminase-like cysteine proteinase